MRHLLLTLPLPLLMLTACGQGQVPPSDLPASVPAPTATGLVQTQGSGIVMGAGPEATLCTGIEYDEDGCDGIALSGWDWQAHAKDAERIGKTYNGYFHLVGRFDGTRLQVTRVTTLDEYVEPTEQPVDEPEVPCKEPAGGWPKPDLERTSVGNVEAAMVAAEKLPDFASAGGPSAEVPDDGEVTPPRDELFTVRVTDDLDRAERTVREHWGGMLCVARAKYGVADAKRTARELNDAAPGVRAVDTGDSVELDVDYDDGTLQAWADEEYGRGLVRVRPALVPT